MSTKLQCQKQVGAILKKQYKAEFMGFADLPVHLETDHLKVQFPHSWVLFEWKKWFEPEGKARIMRGIERHYNRVEAPLKS